MLDRMQQILTQREDLLGVAEGLVPRLRQREPARTAVEELLAEDALRLRKTILAARTLREG